jgi:hypothetical protein
VIVHQDSFYRALSPEERADAVNYNFDHPDAFDHGLMMDCVKALKAGRAVEVPVYDFTTHSRRTDEVRAAGGAGRAGGARPSSARAAAGSVARPPSFLTSGPRTPPLPPPRPPAAARGPQVRKVEAADVVIVEGILVLHDPELREQLNMKARRRGDYWSRAGVLGAGEGPQRRRSSQLPPRDLVG